MTPSSRLDELRTELRSALTTAGVDVPEDDGLFQAVVAGVSGDDVVLAQAIAPGQRVEGRPRPRERVLPGSIE